MTTSWLTDAGDRRRMRGSVGRVEHMGGQERESTIVLGFEEVYESQTL